MSTNPENLVKIGLVGWEISLLRAIVKKMEMKKRKKVTAVKHKLARPASSLARQANDFIAAGQWIQCERVFCSTD